MLVFDELVSKKILIYNNNLERISDSFNTIDKEFSDEPRSIEPDSTLKEPLLVMAEDFVNSIENKIEPQPLINIQLIPDKKTLATYD